MKRICQRCNVISQDFNLWCQEKYCPAENATEIFDNGEWFGPIEIIQPMSSPARPLSTRPSAVMSKSCSKLPMWAVRKNCAAKPRPFLQLAKAGQHPLLAGSCCQPIRRDTVEYHPYGWTVIEGRVKYYEVFEFVDGTILRNLLLKNPQPWYQHVGWITLSIADVIFYLHKAGKVSPVSQPGCGLGAL